ncbi:T9SS type A sorting domain-containing protein [uncultured Prevotella sp.]|uniref:T9SS type A sorting domain-containing protein n=1 Tax=uncultured Prevotella sp. TaxID=159272 RepID=UPI002585EF2B|nr:T9SS type A sorting domain-containing protein [uncultured Prevotella sp.]
MSIVVCCISLVLTVLRTDNQLSVSFEHPLSSSVRLHLYTMNGRLVHTSTVKAGQTSQSLSLGSLPAGIYAVQLDGPSSVKGSTLIRK